MPCSHRAITSTAREWVGAGPSAGKSSNTTQEPCTRKSGWAQHRSHLCFPFPTLPRHSEPQVNAFPYITGWGRWWLLNFHTEGSSAKQLGTLRSCHRGHAAGTEEAPGGQGTHPQPGSPPAAQGGSREVSHLTREHMFKSSSCRVILKWAKLQPISIFSLF